MLSHTNTFQNQPLVIANQNKNELSRLLDEQIDFLEFITFNTLEPNRRELKVTESNIVSILKQIRTRQSSLSSLNQNAFLFLTKNECLEFAIEKGSDSFLIEMLHLHPNLEDFYIINAYRINPRIQCFTLQQRVELLNLHWIFGAFLTEDELESLPSRPPNLEVITAETLYDIGKRIGSQNNERHQDIELRIAAGKVKYDAYFTSFAGCPAPGYPFLLAALTYSPYIAVAIINNLTIDDLKKPWESARIYSDTGQSILYFATLHRTPSEVLSALLRRLPREEICQQLKKEIYNPLRGNGLYHNIEAFKMFLSFCSHDDLIFRSRYDFAPIRTMIIKNLTETAEKFLNEFSTKTFVKLHKFTNEISSIALDEHKKELLVKFLEPYLQSRNELYTKLTSCSSWSHESLQSAFGLTRHQSGMTNSLIKRIEPNKWQAETNNLLSYLPNWLRSNSLAITHASDEFLLVIDRIVHYQKYNKPLSEIAK